MAPVGPLHFTGSEKAALMAFLKTLTDRTLLSDPRFSNPFERKGAVERVRAAVLAVRASLMALGDGAAHRVDVLRSAVNTETPPAPLPPGATSPYLQINRLMSFDGNRDHRLSRDELPERLHVESRLQQATARFVPDDDDREAFDLAQWPELRSLDPAVLTIGSHSMTHPILTRMSEATRLEQSVGDAELERFDVAALVRGCVDGYRSAYAPRQFILDAADVAIELHGAPDLIAQMLDKLVANAVEFGTPDRPIVVRVERPSPGKRLSSRPRHCRCWNI